MQYIIAALLGLGAIIYIILHIRKSMKTTHDCPECEVADVLQKKIR